MIDLELLAKAFPKLLEGAFLSFMIALLSTVIGISLGFFWGAMQCFGNVVANYFVSAYVAFFRGTPMLVQIMVAFYVLPEFGIHMPPFWAACLAIGLNSSAYVSQIVVSGIKAISIGQIESAQTLGISRANIFLYILLPQIKITMLPALANECVTLVKDSSLASVIGVMELSKQASIVKSQTYDAVTVLFAVSVFYFIMTWTVARLIGHVEKRYLNVSV
jgi:His/Glu/Gln/Arg/opine family amino acid ABC transporter permease subunit